MTWLGRRRTTPLPLTPLPRDQGLRQPIVQLQPKLAPVVVATVVEAPIVAAPPRDVPADVLVALESQLMVADEAPSAPDGLGLEDMQFPPLDLDAMKERYPLLRNAL